MMTAESNCNDLMDDQAMNFYKQIRESESVQYLPDNIKMMAHAINTNQDASDNIHHNLEEGQ